MLRTVSSRATPQASVTRAAIERVTYQRPMKRHAGSTRAINCGSFLFLPGTSTSPQNPLVYGLELLGPCPSSAEKEQDRKPGYVSYFARGSTKTTNILLNREEQTKQPSCPRLCPSRPRVEKRDHLESLMLPVLQSRL